MASPEWNDKAVVDALWCVVTDHMAKPWWKRRLIELSWDIRAGFRAVASRRVGKPF